ncbi:MAG: ParB/RepB/Spo0J family partition protein [Alphaproteobacteria bacterium]
MAEEAKAANRLGRGLSALLGYEEAHLVKPAAPRGGGRTLPVAQLSPSPLQPRKHFTPETLEELAASIREKGVLHPILVRPKGEEAFEIIAGERRWRAAQMAGVHEVPVIVRELTDAQVLEAALIENIQREDLNPVEEARAFKALIDRFSHTQDALSRVVGKSRSHIANSLRLLNLPAGVIAFLESGKLTAGHARPLVGRSDAEALAAKIVAAGLSVRATEDLVREPAEARTSTAVHAKPEKDADTLGLERDLSDTLGLKVTIASRGEAGEVRIAYKSLEQLDEVSTRLRRSAA